MRIVIDMQGAQTESRFRGIGRYSVALAKAIVRNRGEHEIFLALSSLFPDTIAVIRDEFDGLLPQENIHIWHGIGPTSEMHPSNATRRKVSEYLREAAIAAMQPNVVLIMSLFEGWSDDAVTSVARFDQETPSAAILYDLIPLITPDEHFRSNAALAAYYQRKLDSLRNCSALLAISESAKNEALNALNYPDNHVTNISSGCDSRFRPMPLGVTENKVLLHKYGITKPFVMYTGGADERKNLNRLIEGFGRLPKSIRNKHQLLLVGKMPAGNVAQYQAHCQRVGLSTGDVLFSGFVSDDELMQLYTACQLFVFPSLHEGFGLPPLEAMACGAPVITSNATSLPEVMGNDNALFDPLSATAITAKIQQVLADDSFRSELIRIGTERVKSFSWDDSARKAITALVSIARPSSHHVVDYRVKESVTSIFKPKLLRILVSKLDHMGDLVLAIPALAHLRARYPEATIDALVGSWNVEQAQSFGIFDHIHTLDFFSKKSAEAANIPKALARVVKQLPRYDIAIDLRRQSDTRFVLSQVHALTRVGFASGDAAVDSHLHVCLPAQSDVPFVKTAMNSTPIALQMLRLVEAIPAESTDYINLSLLTKSIAINSHGVAIFPNAGNSVKEWGSERYKSLVRLLITKNAVCRIGIFVEAPEQSEVFKEFLSDKVEFHCGLVYTRLREVLATYKVCVANNSYGAHLSSVLGLNVVGIFGGHETVEEWGPVFGDCRILSAPVPCSPCHIPDLSACINNFKCLTDISPYRVYSSVLDALNGVSGFSITNLKNKLINSMLPNISQFSEQELFLTGDAIAKNLPEEIKKRLFVDISELVIRDARSGIQRVVRSLLKNLLNKEGLSYDVIPIYATTDEPGYRIASEFLNRFKNLEIDSNLQDDRIDFRAGDIFLGLDFQPVIIATQRNYLKYLRNQGVYVYFIVYDILCMQLKECFDAGLVNAFEKWLPIIAESDGVICISQSVAEDLNFFLKDNNLLSNKKFQIKWFHLGAEIYTSLTELNVTGNKNQIFNEIEKHIKFLMVGTLEPRKGYSEILDAFDHLWTDGINTTLIIVGKVGWQIEKLVKRIKNHEEYGRRLFWLDAISDEYLEEVYANVDCLISASFGEGFGLPLIEAAQHGLPIIARDLKVFREVAGDHAFYFKEEKPSEISHEILRWITLYKKNAHPNSKTMPFLSWNQSAEMLLECIDKMKFR